MGNGHGLHPRGHLERVSTTLKEELPSTLAATTGWEQLEKTGASARGVNGLPLHWFWKTATVPNIKPGFDPTSQDSRELL